MKSLLEQIRENWIILAFVVGMILWYGDTNFRLNTVEAQQEDQKTVTQKVDTLVTDVAVIKTQTQESDKKIDSLSSKVDYIINTIR